MHEIPTVYRERQYRSRLEARWACMFDKLGWRYEYEPFDLPGWIPDFALYGDNGKEILVEVKTSPREDISKIHNYLSSTPNEEVLMLFANPFGVGSEFKDFTDARASGIVLGAIESGSARCPDTALIGPVTEEDVASYDRVKVDLRWDFAGENGCYGRRLSGYHFNCPPLCSPGRRARLRRWWAEAGNEVQWRSPRGQAGSSVTRA